MLDITYFSSLILILNTEASYTIVFANSNLVNIETINIVVSGYYLGEKL